MTLCRRLSGAGEGPLCSCGDMACALGQVGLVTRASGLDPGLGPGWVVAASGWPRPEGVLDWCSACGTSRRNLCRFDADEASGLLVIGATRPEGCLLADRLPAPADPPSFQRYPPLLGPVAVLVLAAIPVLAVLVVLWGKSR